MYANGHLQGHGTHLYTHRLLHTSTLEQTKKLEQTVTQADTYGVHKMEEVVSFGEGADLRRGKRFAWRSLRHSLALSSLPGLWVCVGGGVFHWTPPLLVRPLPSPEGKALLSWWGLA